MEINPSLNAALASAYIGTRELSDRILLELFHWNIEFSNDHEVMQYFTQNGSFVGESNINDGNPKIPSPSQNIEDLFQLLPNTPFVVHVVVTSSFYRLTISINDHQINTTASTIALAASLALVEHKNKFLSGENHD